MWQTMKCCRQRREACKLVRWASRRRCLARDKDMSKIVTGLQSNPVTAHEINNTINYSCNADHKKDVSEAMDKYSEKTFKHTYKEEGKMGSWYSDFRESIKDIIENKGICLLGEIEVSDDEFKRLMEYVKDKITYSQNLSDPRPDLLLSMALVQFAIRHYQEGRYWQCFKEEINEEIPSSRLNYLGKVFYRTIKQYDLLVLDTDGETQQYVENIKAHAFVTNYYMDGYFDFSYAFFENNLFRQLPTEQQEMIDDIEDLALFMSNTLHSEGDSIRSGTSKAAKSYRLLKSTRRVFAQCEATSIYRLFYPTIRMIENNYYDSVLPANTSNRFAKNFIGWCNKGTEEKGIVGEGNAERRPVSKKPYLAVNPETEYIQIIIPAQKFRPDECDKEAKVRITVNNHSEIRDLELRDSFGIYISEELHVLLPNPFDEIAIEFINADARKNTNIKKSSYRILTENWRNTSKLTIGNNYIIVEKGTEILWNENCDIIDKDTSFYSWDLYSVNIDSESSFQIGTTSISIAGEYSREPIFDELITNYELFDKQGNKMLATQEHPFISFEVDRDKVQGSSILINNEVYAVKKIKNKAIIQLPGEKEKSAVTIDLKNIAPRRDGKYEVILDIPGEGNKEICKYMHMSGIKCSTNKKHYIFKEHLYLSFFSENHWAESQEGWKSTLDEDFGVTYEVPINADTKDVSLDIFLYGDPEERYVLKMPVDVFSYGFSADEKIFQKKDYIWYADIMPNLYIRTEAAEEVAVYYEHEKDNLFKGVEIEHGVFQIDISEIRERINKTDRKIHHYINIVLDGKPTPIHLPVILRRMLVHPMYKLTDFDGKACLKIDKIEGDAKMFVSVTDNKTKEVLVEKQYLNEGVNIFDSLPINGFFDIHPFMEETDEFGLNFKLTEHKTIWGVGIVDFNNLTGCGTRIDKLFFEERPIDLERRYYISMRQKLSDNSYLCHMESVETDQKGNNMWETKKKYPYMKLEIYEIEDQIKASLLAYSAEEEDWMPLYYDKSNRSLLGPDSPILMTTTDYGRFESLDDDLTEVILNRDEIKRRS